MADSHRNIMRIKNLTHIMGMNSLNGESDNTDTFEFRARPKNSNSVNPTDPVKHVGG